MHPLTQRCCGRPRDVSLLALRAAAGRWAGRNSLNHGCPLPVRFVRCSSVNSPRRSPPPAFQRPLGDAPPPILTEPYEAKAVVVGGGPAGMAAVANLLDAIPDGKVVWVDQTFQGGHTRLYCESHSYSTAGDFLRFARHNAIFWDICHNAPSPSPIEGLKKLDHQKACKLSHAINMLAMLSDGLIRHERVVAVHGTASGAARDPKTLKWTVTVKPPSAPGHDRKATADYCAPLVVLCTGPKPRELSLRPPLLPPPGMAQEDLPKVPRSAPLNLGLDPQRLSRQLYVWWRQCAQMHPGMRVPLTVAVVGDGHSAVLTLRNLVNTGLGMEGRLHVLWFAREPNLKYTMLEPEEEVEEKEGQSDEAGPPAAPPKRRGQLGDRPRMMLNELDGLQGLAAGWARQELEGESLATSKAGGIIERLILPKPPPPANPQSQRQQRLWEEQREELEGRFILEHAASAWRIFHCVGFEPARLPEIRPALAPLERTAPGGRQQLAVNDRTGSFYPAGGDPAVAIGLFGAGAAFPESVAVPDGPRKPAVSMLAFGQFVKRMAPLWVEAARAGQMGGEEIKMLTMEQWNQRQEGMSRRMKERVRGVGFEQY